MKHLKIEDMPGEPFFLVNPPNPPNNQLAQQPTQHFQSLKITQGVIFRTSEGDYIIPYQNGDSCTPSYCYGPRESALVFHEDTSLKKTENHYGCSLIKELVKVTTVIEYL